MAKTLKCELINLDETVNRLEKLGATTDELMSKALFAGAKVMADGLENAIQALPEDNGFKNIKKGDALRNVVSKEDKADLLSHVGISRFSRSTGKIDARIGFNDYGSIKTKKYPNGRPMILVARSINSGSSVRFKHPFIKPTIAKYKSSAIQTMQKVIEEELKKFGG